MTNNATLHLVVAGFMVHDIFDHNVLSGISRTEPRVCVGFWHLGWGAVFVDFFTTRVFEC